MLKIVTSVFIETRRLGKHSIFKFICFKLIGRCNIFTFSLAFFSYFMTVFVCWLLEKVNMLQYPSSLKQMNFEMECFSSLQSHCKYRGDNLQHSVVNNNEIQSRNSRAVALSTHSRLRFSSSVSLLLGAFDLVYLRATQRTAVPGYEHTNFTFSFLNGSSRP